MPTMPRFSIIITSYNQRAYIEAAVDSAIAQPHTNKEIIVVDDASTDGSQEILLRYSASIRLEILAENGGAIAARNYAATLARGEYLVFLDGDDQFLPWALEVYEQVIADRNPRFVIAFPIWFRGDVPPIRGQDWPQRIEFVEYPVFLAKDRSIWLGASVMLVEHQTFRAVGGWTPGIFQMDIYDLAAKLGEVGRTIHITAPPVVFYRMHPLNTINNVKPFAEMTLSLVKKEKVGQYAKGSNYRFQRRAWFGGIIVYWIKRAAKSGLYKECAALAMAGWAMVLAGIARSISLKFKARRPSITLELPHA